MAEKETGSGCGTRAAAKIEAETKAEIEAETKAGVEAKAEAWLSKNITKLIVALIIAGAAFLAAEIIDIELFRPGTEAAGRYFELTYILGAALVAMAALAVLHYSLRDESGEGGGKGAARWFDKNWTNLLFALILSILALVGAGIVWIVTPLPDRHAAVYWGYELIPGYFIILTALGAACASVAAIGAVRRALMRRRVR